MSIDVLRDFLASMLLINAGILFLTTVILGLLGNWAIGFHAKVFQLDEHRIRQAYFNYLANYKIAVVVFNLAPWLALQWMGV